MKKFTAFTLAEVLITLGIIGVVAALTMPSLMTKYSKIKTEKKVIKFYSLINQAHRYSIIDNGETEYWMIPRNYLYKYEEHEEFMKQYYLPYLKYVEYNTCKHYGASGNFFGEGICVKMPDGTMFQTIINAGSVGIWLFVDGNLKNRTTRNTFGFELASIGSKHNNYKYSIEPHLVAWDGEFESLITDNARGCNNNSTYIAYCTQILKLNNWQITDDYPW